MQYTDQLADQLIEKYNLSRSVKYNWKSAGTIPEYYFEPDYVKPQRITAKQKERQNLILDVIEDPLIKHSFFRAATTFAGKLDEMLTLRRAKATPTRQRKGRPSVPSLNFSESELAGVVGQLQSLGQAIHTTLVEAISQPYERRQETLRELIWIRPELTARQTVEGLEKTAATRWINFVKNVRSHLPESDKGVVAHVFSVLQDLHIKIQQAIYYK